MERVSSARGIVYKTSCLGCGACVCVRFVCMHCTQYQHSRTIQTNNNIKILCSESLYLVVVAVAANRIATEHKNQSIKRSLLKSWLKFMFTKCYAEQKHITDATFFYSNLSGNWPQHGLSLSHGVHGFFFCSHFFWCISFDLTFTYIFASALCRCMCVCVSVRNETKKRTFPINVYKCYCAMYNRRKV